MRALDTAALILLALYALDRLLKLLAVRHFFRRAAPPAPERWPVVSLIQPITRGATNLRAHLLARAALEYPVVVQHLPVCDAGDAESQAVCREALPACDLVLVEPEETGGVVASKTVKMAAGLARANGEVVCFVDDDIGLPPDALRVLVSHLGLPGAGAVFGLACQTSWRTVWSSLMSGFVNANALVGYVPLTYLVEPYTITGHCFALRRDVLDATGGLEGLARRIDDDHEIARRVRRAGLRIVQTPLVYRVDNELGTLRSYLVQMRRWFVFPRQTMLPYLTPRERHVSLLLSVGNLLPSLLGVLALSTWRPAPLLALGLAVALFAVTYAVCEIGYLPDRTPAGRWPLLLVVALVTPLHVLAAMAAGGSRIEWRGQRIKVHRGGAFEVLPP